MSILYIGRHINTITDFTTAPIFGKKLGCNIIQIFLGDPQQAFTKAKSKADLLTFKSNLEKTNIRVVIHGAYSINLCRSPNTSRYRTSLKSLVSDLNSSEIIGSNCLGVIIHMGKNISDDQISNTIAVKNYTRGLSEALKLSPASTYIILETGAGVGTEVGSDIETLAHIYHGLNPSEQSRIKFCIDTCHIWARGYDISDEPHVKKFFSKFDKLIGISKIALIHFNNSKTPIGSRVDRHADLAYGLISLKGLEAIAKFAYKHFIPLIMETPLTSIDPVNNKEITYESELRIVMNWLKI